MMKMNKLIKWVSVAIVWLLNTPIIAQNVQVNLASNRDSVGIEGETVRVPILLDTVYTNDMLGENIIALNLEFSHGAELTPQSFDFTGGLIETWSVNTNIKSGNRFSITAAGVNPIALDSGLLFYVEYFLEDVTSERNPTFTLYTSTGADNYFNEGGYDFTMDFGQIQIQPILQLNTSSSPSRITVGDSTRINASGGTAPYTYSVVDPTFGSIVSDNYFLSDRYGFAEIAVEDANGLQGSTTVEVRAFKLDLKTPEDLIFPGRDTMVYVTTTDLSDLDIISGIFTFYGGNKTNVEFLNVDATGYLLDGFSIEVAEIASNQYKVAFAGSNVIGVGDTLMALNFEIFAEPASTSESLYIVDNTITFNEDLEGNRGTGSSIRFINLVKPNLTFPFQTYIAGDEIQFSSSVGLQPFTWSVSDESIGSIDQNGLLTTFKGGEITVTVTDDLGLTDSEDLLIYDGRITIPNHTVNAEITYDLPIYVTEIAADRAYSSFNMEVVYDPAKLNFAGVSQIGTLAESFSIVTNQTATNKIRIVGAGSNSISDAGTLFHLTFDLLPEFTVGQTSSVRIDDILFDEGSPELIDVDGSIKVGVSPSTGNSQLTIDEDETYVFSTDDFVYTHPESTPINYIRIESLPANGDLTYFSSNVTLNQTIQISSIAQFRYVPETNANGISFDAFEFRVNDGTNFSNDLGSISIDVTAVNDPPSFEVSDSFITTTEDFTQDSVVTFTLNEVPVDEQGETISYSITPESVDFATVSFDDVAMTVIFGAVADSSGSQVFEITADDGQGVNNTFSKTVTLNVNAVDDPPLLADQTFAVNENTAEGTIVGVIDAEDIDSDLQFTIDAGNTDNAFIIESPSGNLIVNNIDALDFETNPVFTLTVSLPHDTNPASATITINLNDVDETVNQAPQIVAQSFSIDENSANGTAVGTVDAFDPESDPLTYSITAGNTNETFAIDAASGALTVNNSTELDFETTPSFSLTVQVADAELNASATITVNLNDLVDTNQAPTIADQTFNVNENSVNGTTVGTVVANDPDTDALTYSITAGNTNSAFTIDAASGALTVADVNQLDFETTPTFSLTVQVADAEFDASATITVNLIDVDETVNQAPQIVAQSFSIDENSANGTAVGTVEAFDPESDPLTYSITAGNTNNAFAIDATSGALTVADVNQLDFETTPSFSLTVQVADAEFNASATITINLNDLADTNQAPTIADQTFNVNENSINGTTVGTVVASDPDSDALTYSISAGNTNSAFAIDAASGALTVADVNQLDFETTPTFSLTVQVADAEFNASATITINLNDVDETVNQAPQIVAQSFNIDENSVNGTAVGTVDVFDPDGDPLTYSITAGNTNNAFAIDAANGTLTVADVNQLDFETTPSFSLTILVADAELNASGTITVNLNDLADTNQAPEIADQTFNVNENSINGTTVGTVVASDPDSDALTYSISAGNTNSAFAIDAASGALTVADVNQLDFETTPTFNLTVQVADVELNASATITVNLNDVDETVNQAPQIVAQSFNIDENSANGTAVGTVVASDPDNDALTYSITAGNTNSAFAIDAASGTLTVADVNQLDFETTPTFSLTVQVADAELNASATITINLNDLADTNQAPTIADQTFNVNENSVNGTTVGTVVASDPDSDALTFSITAGNTNSAFTIDAASGALTVADGNQLDFETTPTFSLTVQVADAEFNASATITINLNDVDETVNQAPQIVAQSFNIDENSANGTAVGTVAASDPDNDPLTYSITAGNTNNAFAIDATSGALSVADINQLDFETTPSFSLTVQVADAEFNASATITINLNDLADTNQAPTIADQTFNVNENSINGTTVGTVVASDPDNDALTYSITAGNTNSAFAIDAASGAMTVADVNQLDFETTPTFSLTVQVADAEFNASATITINLNDVDETVNQAPQIVAQSFNIDENSANGTAVGTVVASDPDNDALTYSITAGNTNSAFAIDAASGALTVADVNQLDFETTPSFSLTVQVADAELNASATITVNLNDLADTNQAPEIVAQTFDIDENSANGTAVGTVAASDPDNDALTYSITAGNTNSAFAIDAASGALTVADVNQLDFETSPTFSLTVQVADAEFSASATITVNLIDVDETANQAPQIAAQSFSVDENSANGTSVGTVVASDPDGDALTYAIIGGNTNNAFVIDPSSGLLSVSNTDALDFETTSSFSLNILVADSELNSSAIITVDLNDLDENALSLSDDVKSKVEYFPNPSIERLNIHFPKEMIQGSWELIGLDGKKVMQGQIHRLEDTIDVSQLVEGSYIIMMRKELVSFSIRIIKK